MIFVVLLFPASPSRKHLSISHPIVVVVVPVVMVGVVEETTTSSILLLILILNTTKPYQIWYTQSNFGVVGIDTREYQRNHIKM